jgi:hypothetical protein
MFELAKQVLTKAGGNSSTSLFTQPTANQNPRGPHRALHMCAFQVSMLRVFFIFFVMENIVKNRRQGVNTHPS